MTRYRTLLDRAVTYSVYDNDEVGLAILATRIPDLCLDCKGSGEVGDIPELRIPPVSCDHPNAPTIARRLLERDLLDISLYDDEFVVFATRSGMDDHEYDVWLSGVNDALRALRDFLRPQRTEAEQSEADR